MVHLFFRRFKLVQTGSDWDRLPAAAGCRLTGTFSEAKFKRYGNSRRSERMLRLITDATWGVLLTLMLLVAKRVSTREANGPFLSTGFVPGLAPLPSRSQPRPHVPHCYSERKSASAWLIPATPLHPRLLRMPAECD